MLSERLQGKARGRTGPNAKARGTEEKKAAKSRELEKKASKGTDWTDEGSSELILHYIVFRDCATHLDNCTERVERYEE